MKKAFSLLSFLLAALMLFTSCTPASVLGLPFLLPLLTPEETTPETTTPDATTPEEIEPEAPAPMPKKILAIGNSFSDDAMEHLAEILVGEGYTDFVLGNLYVGGCSLDGHKSRIDSGAADYDFRVNTGSGWSSSKQSIQYGLTFADWDIVTIQQVSGYSGIPESYDNLQSIVDYVRETALNPDVKVMWHMTWAYQGNSTHADFPKYNSDQMTMYNAILDTAKEKILTNETIDGIIPSGTAIQNLRTSYLGDTITRDGYHLSYDIGRYTAALVWYKQLMGADITDLTVIPTKYPLIEAHLPAIKEAVNNAVQNPFEVTNATVTERVDLMNKMTDSDRNYLTGLGLDPDNYELLDLGITVGAYYWSTNASFCAALVTTSGNSRGYIATKLFTSQTLPVGSVINVIEGYQYRLEGWQQTDRINAEPRRDNSKTGMIVDEALYTKYNFIGFNISKAAGGAATYDDGMGFRIYVPKTN